MKTSKIMVFLLLAVIVMTFSPQRCVADIYSGSLSNLGGTLSATDGWIAHDGEDTTLVWEITDQGGYYEYKYTFSNASGLAAQLSHITIQVSLDFDVEKEIDFENLTSYPLDSDDPKPYDNPYGSDFFGIKFETNSAGDPVVLKFNSMREPMWGNFFAKDGRHLIPGTSTSVMAYAWNTTPNTVAVPDTNYIPVPPAVLLGMLGMCVAGIKLRKYA